MIRRLPSTRRRFGFSLIEVLVGLSILTAGVLAIMAIFPLMLQAQNNAELLTIGASLAQMKVEEIRRDDDRNGDLVTAIRNMTTPSNPIVFPHEPRLEYSFCGRSLLYTQAAYPGDPLAADGVARVIIRYSPQYRSSQDVIYELPFN